MHIVPQAATQPGRKPTEHLGGEHGIIGSPSGLPFPLRLLRFNATVRSSNLGVFFITSTQYYILKGIVNLLILDDRSLRNLHHFEPVCEVFGYPQKPLISRESRDRHLLY